MTKPTINKLFFGSIIAIAGGVVLVVIGGLLAFANGTIVMSGPDVTGFRPSSSSWGMIAIAVVGVFVVIGGGVGQLVAWLGAVVNTSRLDDKTWFVLLLVLGLLSFGFVAMLVYVLAGPDGTLPSGRGMQPA